MSANTYTPGDVMQNPIGIAVSNAVRFNAWLRVPAPEVAEKTGMKYAI